MTKSAFENLKTEQRQLDPDGVEVGVSRQALDMVLAEYATLTAFLHARRVHPDFEYETTHGGRKSFDEHEPEGEGWERNVEEGRNGWERFDYHEEAYWRRRTEPRP